MDGQPGEGRSRSTAPARLLAHQLEPTGPAAVLAAIAGLGRTEDLRFSPDGRRLAVACFHAGAIAVVDVEVAAEPDPPAVVHEGIVRIAAEGLVEPHGVDWLDDETLIVADRAGPIGLLEAGPPCPGDVVDRTAELIDVTTSFADAYGPGSVRVVRRGPGTAEVLVCSNWGNCATRTRFERDSRWAVVDSRVELRHLLDLPDGVAASDDGAWLAVSNHNRQVVVIYDGDGGAGAEPGGRAPVGVLRGSSFPHGLRFTDDGELLAVADAGSPNVHVHWRGERGWSIAGYPTAAIEVLHPDEFARGRARPDEGGPKGIELDASERLLATTCEAAPLRWFDWRAARSSPAPSPADRVALEVEGLQRETDLKAAMAEVEHRLMAAEVREHEARALASRTTERLAEAEARSQENSEWAERELDEARRAADALGRRLHQIESSTVWHATAPLRRLHGLAARLPRRRQR